MKNQDEYKYHILNVYINMSIVNEKLLKFNESMEFIEKAERVDASSQKVQGLKVRMQQILQGIENGTITKEDLGKVKSNRVTYTIPENQEKTK